MSRFKEKVEIAIESFVKAYGIDFVINPEQSAEGMLNSIFVAFRYQRPEEKIYIIIDEYDHFANEILTFNKTKFKEMVARNGRIRKWYEILKEGTETIVDRIFITGVAPITLESLTSGFNIASDITRDIRFNEMIGFSKEEIIAMMNEQNLSQEEQEKLLPILKENYDGYRFNINAKEQMYNSNMTLYFLSNYVGLGKMPDSLIDVNIASDYGKLADMLNLCSSDEKKEIIEKSMTGKPIVKGYHSAMIEFKYLKKNEEDKLEETQKHAREQIEKYSKYDEMQDIENLHKYTVIAVVDDIYVETLKKMLSMIFQ